MKPAYLLTDRHDRMAMEALAKNPAIRLYDMREWDEDPDMATIEKRVFVNYFGSVATNFDVPLDPATGQIPDGWAYLDGCDAVQCQTVRELLGLTEGD